jgi:sortase (surface protein transpeptidase)
VAVGRVVFVAGVLILLFIPYLLWGTGLMTARSQALLRTEFHQAQQRTGSDPVTVRSPPKKAPAGDVQLAPTTSDPSIGSPVATIDIPKIGLSMVVVEGTDEIRLQQGPGHYPGTPLPGQSGNVAIAGHRTTYLHSFCNLNELITGDPIIITTTQGQFQYGVITAHPDHVQSALQRVAAPGGARCAGEQCPGSSHGPPGDQPAPPQPSDEDGRDHRRALTGRAVDHGNPVGCRGHPSDHPGVGRCSAGPWRPARVRPGGRGPCLAGGGLLVLPVDHPPAAIHVLRRRDAIR